MSRNPFLIFYFLKGVRVERQAIFPCKFLSSFSTFSFPYLFFFSNVPSFSIVGQIRVVVAPGLTIDPGHCICVCLCACEGKRDSREQSVHKSESKKPWKGVVLCDGLARRFSLSLSLSRPSFAFQHFCFSLLHIPLVSFTLALSTWLVHKFHPSFSQETRKEGTERDREKERKKELYKVATRHIAHLSSFPYNSLSRF